MSATVTPTPHDLLIRGVRVRYYEAGDGPPLVLVHGFLVNHHCWSLVMPELAKHFRVIAPDLPGFGESEKPTAYPYNREAFAETLCDLLAGIDVPRAHVCGHSMGGSVAIALASKFPERVERLALINTVSYAFDMPFKARLPLLPVVGPIVFKSLYNRMLFHDYFKRNVFAPGFKYDRAVVDEYYRAFDPPEAREAAYRALQDISDLSSLGPMISKVRAPTLVLWGEADPMFKTPLGTRLARDLPNARIETLPGCGHDPPSEKPERTAELLLQHFRGNR